MSAAPAPPGQFLGKVRHRHTSPDWVVTELRHGQPNQFPAHEHRWTCLTFLLGGQYAERTGAAWAARGINSLVVRPALAPHADRIGPAGAWFLTVELAPGVVARRVDAVAPLADWRVVGSPELVGLGWRLAGELRRGAGGDDAVIAGYVEALIAALAPRPGGSREPPGWLRRALERLHDAPGERVSLESLARECGVHPAHFTRAFRQHVGQTLGTYQRMLGLRSALGKLGEPGSAPARVAGEAGFYDQAHLSRTLRAVTGLTPGAYRASAALRP